MKISQISIDSIFDSNPEFAKHFVLKMLSLKNDEFLYIGLKDDSSGKNLENLESIIETLGKFLEKVEYLDPDNIVFSFRNVEYFGDLGNAFIVRLAIIIDEKEGKFIVLEPQPKVRNVLEILGLNEIWPIYNSEEEFMEVINEYGLKTHLRHPERSRGNL